MKRNSMDETEPLFEQTASTKKQFGLSDLTENERAQLRTMRLRKGQHYDYDRAYIQLRVIVESAPNPPYSVVALRDWVGPDWKDDTAPKATITHHVLTASAVQPGHVPAGYIQSGDLIEIKCDIRVEAAEPYQVIAHPHATSTGFRSDGSVIGGPHYTPVPGLMRSSTFPAPRTAQRDGERAAWADAVGTYGPNPHEGTLQAMRMQVNTATQKNEMVMYLTPASSDKTRAPDYVPPEIARRRSISRPSHRVVPTDLDDHLFLDAEPEGSIVPRK